MSTYDPGVLKSFAERMYRKASGVVLAWSCLGAFAGFLGGMAAQGRLSGFLMRSTGLVWACSIIGLVLGWMYGRERAFMYKLEAQRALCQLQIEQNTRALDKPPPPG